MQEAGLPFAKMSPEKRKESVKDLSDWTPKEVEAAEEELAQFDADWVCQQGAIYTLRHILEQTSHWVMMVGSQINQSQVTIPVPLVGNVPIPGSVIAAIPLILAPLSLLNFNSLLYSVPGRRPEKDKNPLYAKAGRKFLPWYSGMLKRVFKPKLLSPKGRAMMGPDSPIGAYIRRLLKDPILGNASANF